MYFERLHCFLGGDPTRSSSEIWETDKFVNGPDLPYNIYDFCFDAINSTHGIVAGGAP